MTAAAAADISLQQRAFEVEVEVRAFGAGQWEGRGVRVSVQQWAEGIVRVQQRMVLKGHALNASSGGWEAKSGNHAPHRRGFQSASIQGF